MNSQYMKMCLNLAKKGRYTTQPNPMVGAILVKNGTIIGKGYHKQYKKEHAEVLAIKDALSKGYEVKGSTLYVNLEPCFHYGHQPPCVDEIIKRKIKKVVIAMKDPNPLTCGKSIEKLKKSGIDVEVGLLEEEAKSLNKVFVKYITTKKPFVSIKVAQSMDGKIVSKNNEKFVFSTHQELKYVHNLRQQYMAILTTPNTIIADNPLLNVRYGRIYRQPIRIVVDSTLKIPMESNIIQTAKMQRTIIATLPHINKEKKEKILSMGAEIIHIESSSDMKNYISLSALFHELGKMKISSILVEAGGLFNYLLLEKKLVDYAYFFVYNCIIGGYATKTSVEGDGFEIPIKMEYQNVKKIENSILLEGAIRYV